MHATKIPRLAYYDNPEPFVPGGYSHTAAEVMREAQGILFANETLAKATIYSEIGKEVDFGSRKRTDNSLVLWKTLKEGLKRNRKKISF
jgi:hypothetical protein